MTPAARESPVPRTVAILPPDQLSVLERHYDAAVKARQRHTLFGAAVVLVAMALSVWMGEVRPGVLFANAGRLTDYFWNIVPTLRWDSLGADLAEWYWNLDNWLKLLLDTVLILRAEFFCWIFPHSLNGTGSAGHSWVTVSKAAW